MSESIPSAAPRDEDKHSEPNGYGLSGIRAAAFEGDVEWIRRFGPPPGNREKSPSPFTTATSGLDDDAECLGVMKALFDKGWRPPAAETFDDDPLIGACSKAMADSFDFLVGIGSAPSQSLLRHLHSSGTWAPGVILAVDRIATSIVKACRWTPEASGAALGALAGKGCPEAIKAIIDAGADPSGKHGTEAVIKAVHAGDLKCLETLLLAGASCDEPLLTFSQAQSEAVVMLRSWNEAVELSRTCPPLQTRTAPGI